MRIYLDNDVPRAVQDRLRQLGDVVVVRAIDVGRTRTRDEVTYCLAVRERFDLVITCNTVGRPGFMSETLRHLQCRERDLPVPIYELREGGNDWGKIEPRWAKHEARIKQELTDLGNKHDKRRDRAIEVLDRLERATAAEPKVAQQPTPTPTQIEPPTRNR